MNNMIEKLEEDLRGILDELENVGGEKHVKSASLRVRNKLAKLKNEITSIKKYLVGLDKSN